jgi:hypothetical protein
MPEPSSQAESTKESAEDSQKSHDLLINYLKSHYFRVIHADGIWGGVSPRGNIHMSFYNERAALPDISRVTLSDQGQQVAPERYKSSSKIVREIEADVIIDLTTAKALSEWLLDKIQTLEGLIKEENENPQEEVTNDAR